MKKKLITLLLTLILTLAMSLPAFANTCQYGNEMKGQTTTPSYTYTSQPVITCHSYSVGNWTYYNYSNGYRISTNRVGNYVYYHDNYGRNGIGYWIGSNYYMRWY